jgi:arylsulfatase A-like enzyme
VLIVARERRTASFTARWGAVTAALCIIHLVLSLAIPEAPLRMTAATPVIAWGLLSQEFIAIGALAVLPALPGTWYTRAFMSFVAMLVIGGGWIAFLATDQFPGIDSARFFFTVPEQAFEHLLQMRAALLLLVPVVIVIGTVLLTRLALRAGKEFATRQSKILVLISAAIVGGSLAWHGIAKATLGADDRELLDPRTGVSYRTNLFWDAAREAHAGPASALLRSSIVALRRGATTSLPVDSTAPVEHPPRAAGELAHTGVPSHRWNVLVIEIESLRGDMLRAWGSPIAVMPSVEAIAAESRRYLDSYTTATQTNLAAAVPLSGQYPLRDPGPRAYPEKPAYPRLLLYDLLAPLGWRSAIFSSQNESWWGMVNFLRSPSLDTLFNAENFHGHTIVPGEDLAFAAFVTRAKRSGKIDDHDTMLEAIRWLDRDQRAPFFLYINMQTSHIPYAIPATARHDFGHVPSFPVMFGRYPADSAGVVRNQYRNALAYIDDQIGLLRASLIADGRWDSTIVVITGDHGQAFFEHGVAAHANGLWQEQLRVPLVIKAPRVAAGDDRRAASHVDVAPTITALLGLPEQPAWQGISLVGDPPPDDRPRFFMVQSPLADEIGVVSGQWKMVHNMLNGSTRFTDLVGDPREHRDVRALHPVEAERIQALLDTWRAAQLDYYGSISAVTTSFPPRVGVRLLPQ